MKYYDGYGYNFYYDTYGYYEYSVHPTFSEGTVSMIYLALGVALCVVAIVGSYFEQKKADAKAFLPVFFSSLFPFQSPVCERSEQSVGFIPY